MSDAGHEPIVGRRWRLRVRALDVMVLAAIVAYAGIKGGEHRASTDTVPSAFASAVHLQPFDRIAVQADGRLRSFESHAKTFLGYVTGPRSIHGQSNGFTYLDLALRPGRYVDTPLIYVKNKNVRAKVRDELLRAGVIDAAGAERLFQSGLVSRRMLAVPAVSALLDRLGRDLMRTSKAIDAIQSALTVSDPRFLLDNLRVVAPPSGRVDQPWLSITRFTSAASMPKTDAQAGAAPAPIAGLDSALQREVADAWTALRDAWRGEDAPTVNAQVAKLAGLFPTVSRALYPSDGRLATESWYFRTKSMTWVWLLYLAGVVPLLMSVIYRWDGARKIGMVLFVVAFLAHTASLGVRWYISGRWPNANMFEAVTTSAWFGGVGALILEWVARRSALRNLFALGSSVMSMFALMAAYFLPAQLNAGINNKMAALNDVWLYIHTNMIIWSYAVIGLACVPAVLQLRHRWCKAWDGGSIPKVRLLVLPIVLVVFNYTAYRLLMHVMDDPARQLTRNGLIGTTVAFWASLMILGLEWTGASAKRRFERRRERAASGGASALILGPGMGGSFLKDEAPTQTQVFDGATMVLVELSFIMLWTGIIMGAIWADHSWGRPWGWDPKEVFALNTFLIFLVLIHVRLKVQDKAFWTAVLAVVGFEVMMFNWIVVNFVISGLHSYA